MAAVLTVQIMTVITEAMVIIRVTETVETEVTVLTIMETAVRTTVRTVVTTADLAISSLIRLEIK